MKGQDWLVIVLLMLCGVTLADRAFAEPVSLAFDDVAVSDLAKVAYSEIGKSSYVMPSGFSDRVSIKLDRVSPAVAIAAVDEVLNRAGFKVLRRAGVVWIEKATDEQEIVVYLPRHRASRYLSDVVQAVTGARSLLSRGIKNSEMQQPAQQGRESTTSALGQLDRQEVDQVAFTVASKDAGKVRKLLEELDTESGEVVLKAAVFEVGTDRTKGSALQIAASILGGKLGLNVSGGSLVGTSSASFIGGGFDLALEALDADSRFKSVTRPQVRVKNGATARFSVGQDVPVLGAVQLDKNGNSIQSVEYKQSGVILTATPEIRRDVVEVNLSQELSSFVLTNTGVNNSPTLQKRSVSTRLSLQPGEVVILAGLEDAKEDEQTNRLPWFNWIIGQREANAKSDVLILLEVQKI